jgi:hypothetical protein
MRLIDWERRKATLKLCFTSASINDAHPDISWTIKLNASVNKSKQSSPYFCQCCTGASEKWQLKRCFWTLMSCNRNNPHLYGLSPVKK